MEILDYIFDAFFFKLATGLTSVSAASFIASVPLAPRVVAASYGTNLVSAIEIAPAAGPLPTVLAQTSVTVRDRTGVERTVPLWFVSPSQINCYIPAQILAGTHGMELRDSG